jgi:hypothetical protein
MKTIADFKYCPFCGQRLEEDQKFKLDETLEDVFHACVGGLYVYPNYRWSDVLV